MITNIIFILCLGFFVKHSLFPKINQFKSAKNTGETIKKLQKQGKKIYLLNDKSFAGGFMLYSENFLNITDDTQKLIRLFNSDNIVLLVENDKLQKFKNKLLPYKIIFRDLVGHSDMIILEKK
jgi:hypothetical protein